MLQVYTIRAAQLYEYIWFVPEAKVVATMVL